MILYVATTNPGKLRDFASVSASGSVLDLAAGAHGSAPHAASPASGAVAPAAAAITLEPLTGLASIPAPAETCPTFAGNAGAKAISYSLHAPGLLVLADDSGLEVDALSGAPGVRSARFADDHAFRPARFDGDGSSHPQLSTDERNNLCLLDLLSSTPPHGRTARYRCALTLARDGNVLLTAEGTVDGAILEAPRGTGGFGYDPLFLIPERGLTMAELPTADRLQFSHRARAFRALLPQLAELPGLL